MFAIFPVIIPSFLPSSLSFFLSSFIPSFLPSFPLPSSGVLGLVPERNKRNKQNRQNKQGGALFAFILVALLIWYIASVCLLGSLYGKKKRLKASFASRCCNYLTMFFSSSFIRLAVSPLHVLAFDRKYKITDFPLSEKK